MGTLGISSLLPTTRWPWLPLAGPALNIGWSSVTSTWRRRKSPWRLTAAQLVCARHRSLDEPFLAEGPLPPTSAGGRRIDYGWGSWSLPATATSTSPGLADHWAVGYGFDLDVPSGCRGPPRTPCGGRSDEVLSEDAWAAVWDGQRQAFADAVAALDVDKAWSLLSSTAEEALSAGCQDSPADSQVGVPRHGLWEPRRDGQGHKAAWVKESLLLVTLRRLRRRLLHLRHDCEDGRLVAKIRRSLLWLGEAFPQLLSFCEEPDSEELLTVVESLVSAEVAQQKSQALRRWREDTRDDVCAQRAWIKRRGQAEVEAARPAGLPSCGASSLLLILLWWCVRQRLIGA